MDIRKLETLLRSTPSDLSNEAAQRAYEDQKEKMALEIKKKKSLMSTMIQGEAWKLLEDFKNKERESLYRELYTHVRNRDYPKAEKVCSDIEAINKLFAQIINMIGPVVS